MMYSVKGQHITESMLRKRAGRAEEEERLLWRAGGGTECLVATSRLVPTILGRTACLTGHHRRKPAY